MPAEPQPVVRAAVPADAGPVAAIFAHYVATSVATFEEVAPTAADWLQRFGELAARNLPFLVAEDGVAGTGVAGWGGRDWGGRGWGGRGWRVCLRLCLR